MAIIVGEGVGLSRPRACSRAISVDRSGYMLTTSYEVSSCDSLRAEAVAFVVAVRRGIQTRNVLEGRMTSGEHVWSLRARLSGRKQVTVYSRKHAIVVGPPLAFSDVEALPTALELLLAALAADVIGGFEAACRRRRLRFDSVEVALAAKCEEPLAHVGVRGITGSPRLDRGSLTLYVASDEEESDLRAAWEETLARAPVVETLKTSMVLEMKLRLN